MTENSIILSPQNSIIEAASNPFQDAIDLLLYSLSDASKRQYKHTLQAWAKFCQERDLDYNDMRVKNLMAFFDASGLSQSTKQARLSHLRKLLETLHAAAEDNRLKSVYTQVKMLKIKRSTEEKQTSRKQNRLQPMEVLKVFAS
jgi:hypothetical protein